MHELVELAEGARGRMQMLLRAFRAHPALVRQKVHEYEQLGYFLPFSLREFGSMPTGIDGLAKILAPSRMTDEAASGFKRARNILVVGGPGSGKTTLLVQILHHNLLHANRNVLMLTFEELTPVLAPAYHDHFGWRVDFVRSVHLDPQQDPGDFLATVHRVVRAEEPDLVAIDGLSRLRWAFPEHYRDLVDSLFKSLQVRGITSISSIEDPQTQGPAEEYQADGVVHLSQDGEARHLWIEKLRGQDYVAGMHAFEILDRAAVKRGRDRLSEADQVDYPFQPGINVYPNEQYYAAAADAPGAPKSDPVPKYIKTGVKNLDLLLPGGQPKEDGYRRGDAILVLGSPGAGKTLFGLHFLQADLEAVGPSPSPRHRVLWMSFEGPRRLLERSVASFDSDVGFQQLLKRPEFLFEFVPPALISPEKVFYHVTELVRRFDIGRIVIDSVSEIEEAFPNEKRRFRQYMTTFIHTLACRDVSSMFLYRVSGFFRTSRESESDIATLVDTIISIKTFDMKNKIRRGLFVLKSRGRELRSQLQTMDIHMKYGIQLSSKGWEMEGLLSGETGSIHEPEIFLKHFYENPAESRINVAITREFKRRYPKGRFTEVRKPAIHSEFWSFRGHYGAGHANIRVISISRYMVEAFRERDSLHALEDLFPEKLQEQIRKDERWSRYATEAGGYDSIPMYIDMGFLVARRDLAGTLLDRIKDAERPEPSALFGRDASGTLRFQRAVRWEDLTQLAATVNELNSPGAGGMDPPGVNEMGSRSPYVFALPYLYNKTEFMAFFFELLWSKGGDIYHFPIWDGPRGSGRDAFYKEQIFLNRSLWLEVRQIVIDAKDGKGSLYSLEELRQRIRPFLGALLPGAEGLTGETAGPPVEDQLVRWIDASVLGNPVFSIQNEDVITIKNRFGCEALAHLYDLVYDAQNSIPNPYDGEFRSASVFSRHWYSQIQGMRDEAPAAPDGTRPDVIEVLPLPSFSNGEGHRRSCTCETVWCLGVVREALSPEIGWIFIDTLTSKEWVEKRSKLRSGFPYNLEEIKSMERFDMGAYKILREIVDNKRGKDRIYDAQRRLVAPESSPDEVSKAAKDFFDGRYHLRDVADVLDYFGRHPDYEERREAFERGVPQGAKIHGPTSELSDFEDFGEDTGLRSKLPDHRPMFHRVESILHDEIVRLFSPQGRRDWYAVLGTGSAIAGTDEEIDRALKARREDQTENGLIARSLSRIHDRLVFELLISMPGELKKLLQQKTPQGDVPPR
ncbi:MAG TPA: ATPase domain-containing protein [Thermoanaerobaculia bacterium]|nr:ATPase domain-containing protein [Thermoanaerobaculia bacterium]